MCKLLNFCLQNNEQNLPDFMDCQINRFVRSTHGQHFNHQYCPMYACHVDVTLIVNTEILNTGSTSFWNATYCMSRDQHTSKQIHDFP